MTLALRASLQSPGLVSGAISALPAVSIWLAGMAQVRWRTDFTRSADYGIDMPLAGNGDSP